MIDLDTLDRALLEPMQIAVPLCSRPYREIGMTIGLSEDEVLGRVRRLVRAGVIRQIGAIFDTRRLGYQSTLVAFHVGDGVLVDVAAQVSAHPGVSHNYARPHHYNLWFTLAVPPGRNVEDDIVRMARRTGVGDWLNLPALRVFKIHTHFRLGEDQGIPAADVQHTVGSRRRELTGDDIIAIRALQQDLPIVPRPFAETARRYGLDEQALLDRAREFESAGVLRRFSAVLRHRRVGYTANGMACWAVPATRIEAAGQHAAGYPQVSHCYHRPAYPPRWPYTLFAMIHGQNKADVETVAAGIDREIGPADHAVLYSTQEFKKERVRYFEEET